jgi:hypothetical protein
MESVESNFSLINGIRFETLVPERVLIIPNQENIKNRVEFGIKVTNQTSTPYRFVFVSLVPELVGPEGEAIEFEYTVNSPKATSASDCLLAKPDESLTFFTKAKFNRGINKLILSGRDLMNGCWRFGGLRPVRYWVRFTYRNRFQTPKLNSGRTPWPFSEKLWTGIAPTPYEEFYLKYPQN